MIWHVGTNQAFMMGTLKPLTGAGHSSMNEQYYFASPWRIVAHPFSALATYTQVGDPAVPGCTTCEDEHFNADKLHPENPIIGGSGNAGGEIFGLSISPFGQPTMRFVKTYSSGNIPGNPFQAAWAIGSAGQQRTMFCWSSDMLGQLGTYISGTKTNLRADVFCVGLAGQ
jgi:hypothetical protein